MGSLISREEGREGSQREMDTRERDKISLELVKINVQGAIEAERRCDGGDDLSNEAVEVRIAWLCNAETLLADVEDGFVINLHENSVLIIILWTNEQAEPTMNEQSECSRVV
jgi:hypothetical protein